MHLMKLRLSQIVLLIGDLGEKNAGFYEFLIRKCLEGQFYTKSV